MAGSFLMPETPLIGTPVHAVVLEPLSATFPVAGEVVILKRIGNGRIRVRSRHLYKDQPVTEEFDETQLAKLRLVPNTDKPRQPAKLNGSIWRRHVREKYGNQ